MIRRIGLRVTLLCVHHLQKFHTGRLKTLVERGAASIRSPQGFALMSRNAYVDLRVPFGPQSVEVVQNVLRRPFLSLIPCFVFQHVVP